MSPVVEMAKGRIAERRVPGDVVSALAEHIARIYLAEFQEFYSPDQFREMVGDRIERAIARLEILS